MTERSGLETWSGVELRHLAALVAIHEERSFRGAADRLGYVQSAVSQRLSQLEAIVGTRLVNRTRGHTSPVQLTDAGLLLLDHATCILSQLEAAQADLRSFATADGTERLLLRVGIDTGVARRLAPTILTQLAARQPELQVSFLESGCDRRHLERIERGELDAAFAELPLGQAPVSGVPILEDPCVLVVRAGSPLAQGCRLPTLTEIAAVPLVALIDWPLMRLIESHVRSAGCRLQVVTEASTGISAQALVAAGGGAAILPRLSVDEADPAVATIDLSHLLPRRQLAVCWHERRRNLTTLDAFTAAAVVAARKVIRSYGAPAGVAPEPARSRAAAA